MSAYAEFEFVCDCDAATPLRFKKPGNYRTVFPKLNCSGCGATWELKLRETPQGFGESHRLIQGSAKLADALRKKQLEKLLEKPVKKPFSIFMGRS